MESNPFTKFFLWVLLPAAQTFCSISNARSAPISTNETQRSPVDAMTNIPSWVLITFPEAIENPDSSGRISGTKYNDLNGNGVRDSLEPGLRNWRVHLRGPDSSSTNTDSLGRYAFNSLRFGQYVVSEGLEEGWLQTFPSPPGAWTFSLSSSTPSRGNIDFGNRRTDTCRTDFEWRRGPAIKIAQGLNYWPKDQAVLNKMRPGDVIGISVYAEDLDYLVQKCTDCDGGVTIKKWGPYADRVIYKWALVSGDPGQLIDIGNSENNMVMYQIPLCGWGAKRATQSATVTVEITNDPNALKVVDPSILGTSITLNMKKDYRELPGWIQVEVVITSGQTQPDETIIEVQEGACVPQGPNWTAFTQIINSDVTFKDAPDLCPNYLTLLSVEAGDFDEAELKCIDPDPNCLSSTRMRISGDPLQYEWKLASGAGEFPLGNTGPVVAFRRSRTQDGLVQCSIIRDSRTQANDPQVSTSGKLIFKAKKPRAFVGIGDATTWYGARIIDLERAAEKAKEKYEALGYEVEHNPSATINDVVAVIKTSCYQALWITGHGAIGAIFMLEPPTPNIFTPLTLGFESRIAWGCSQQPFIRELVLLGCNTYNASWPQNLVCGKVHSFHYTLVANLGGQIVGRNPYIWELKHHAPPAPHDLSAP